MNQTQRNFLIKKIEDSTKLQIKALESNKQQFPDLNLWLLHAVLSNDFQMRPIEEIRETIRQRALKNKEREDWMGNTWGSANKSDMHFKAREIFILPDEYEQKVSEARKANEDIDEKIRQLHIQSDSLITRITLASDKTLQTMINEVDNMGDISLMDTKIKALTS